MNKLISSGPSDSLPTGEPTFGTARSTLALLPFLALASVLAIGCLSSPGTDETGDEEIGMSEDAVEGEDGVEEDVEVAPPPHPAPLCQDPEIKDITCSYIGFQKGQLIGAMTVTPSGTGKFSSLIYAQQCKFTTAVSEDSGGYCGAGKVADTARRECPASLDTLRTVSISSSAAVPLGNAAAQEALRVDCEVAPQYIFGSAPGKGMCCPAPPIPPTLTLPPPLPYTPTTPEPIPFKP